MSKSKKDGKLYLGIDVGGTKTLAALVQSSGKILARRRAPTPRGAPEETLATVVQTIHELPQVPGVNSGHDRSFRLDNQAISELHGLGFPILVENLYDFCVEPYFSAMVLDTSDHRVAKCLRSADHQAGGVCM